MSAKAETTRPADWTEPSHGAEARPDYDTVFPAGSLQTLTITLTPADWAAMNADIADIFKRWQPVRDRLMASGKDLAPEDRQTLLRRLMKEHDAGQPPAKPTQKDDRQPIWVPATIKFEGQEWTHVGLRYKGVSSLIGAWMLGDPRLPLKLDFDQFEDAHPEVRNQRFFGFKQLSLANNTRDPAAMRDILAYDILRNAGLASLRAVPCEMMLDHGSGPQRLGLYTMIEVVDDTGVQANFGSKNGNIYEGYGRGASFGFATDGQMEADLEKKNNTKAADYGDVRALYRVLHDPKRTSEPAAWRFDLQTVFNTDAFLEWLGFATFIGHADTYGTLEAVNFFLYDDPATGQLNWISWDHNDAFNETLRPFLTFERTTKGADFPLIRFLLDDPVLRQHYIDLLAENATGAFATDTLTALINQHAAIIAPAATREGPDADYARAVADLVAYVTRSEADLQAFLKAR